MVGLISLHKAQPAYHSTRSHPPKTRRILPKPNLLITQRDRTLTEYKPPITKRDRTVTKHNLPITQRDRTLTDHNSPITQCDRCVT